MGKIDKGRRQPRLETICRMNQIQAALEWRLQGDADQFANLDFLLDHGPGDDGKAQAGGDDAFQCLGAAELHLRLEIFRRHMVGAEIVIGNLARAGARFTRNEFIFGEILGLDAAPARQGVIWRTDHFQFVFAADAAGETETYVGIKSPEDDGEEGWHEWSQDPDTLDTWFSSALWTWSTLIDPGLAEDYSLSLEDLLEQSPDFQAYHPTTVMETGWDILFFWVARMILSTTYATKQLPFKTVYLHGMIRAEDGKKMSKSRPESIINPMEVIPKYGTDALRTALVWGNAPGQDMSWNWQKIESTRNFANKLWNIARFIEGVVGDDYKKGREVKPKTVADHWMLIKLQQSTDKIAKDLDNYRFSEAFDTLYHTIWDEFADWYIEASKADQNPFILAYCLEVILKIAHPFMPFITETIWQTLRWEEGSLLVLSTWPELEPGDIEIASAFETIRAVVSESRAISRNLELSKPKLLHTGSELLTEHNELIIQLARLDTIEQVADPTGLKLTQTSQGCWIEVDESTARNYLTKLEQKQTAEALNVERLIARLANKSYVDNAPAHLVAETKGQLEDARTRLEQITAEIDNFSIEN